MRFVDEKMAGESSDDSHSCTMKESPRIVIIGAGIAGIAAGNLLVKEGLTDFVILEASDRVGGRIWSVDLESAPGRKAELGANWIHGIDANPIFKIAKANQLLNNRYQGRKLGQKHIFLNENGEPVNTKAVEEVDWNYGMLMARCEDFYQMQEPTPDECDSVGAFVEREFEEKLDRYSGEDRITRWNILQQRLLGECIISGCDTMHDLALSEVGSFQELPGVHYVIPPGFEEIVRIMQCSIPPDRIHLNHIVSQIQWGKVKSTGGAQGNEFPVCVECQNGHKFYADHVIVTIPLGYLKKQASRLFHPQLPEFKRESIKRLAMGTVNKVILEFDGRVLPEGIVRLELIRDRNGLGHEDISTTWMKKIGSFEAIADNVLIGWLSGREAEYMETLAEKEVGESCVDMLQKFLRHSITKMPRLLKITRSTWKKSAFTLGSYCFIPVGALSEDVENMAEPINNSQDKPVLLFAGEATHPQYYSSSHGALLSGEREAQRISDLYHSQ